MENRKEAIVVKNAPTPLTDVHVTAEEGAPLVKDKEESRPIRVFAQNLKTLLINNLLLCLLLSSIAIGAGVTTLYSHVVVVPFHSFGRFEYGICSLGVHTKQLIFLSLRLLYH